MWWLLFWAATIAGSFVVERRAISPGQLLSSVPVRSLRDCTGHCTQAANCTGFNFLIDATKSAHCLLMDSSKPGESEKLLAEAVLYSGRQFDLNDCGQKKRTFSFEKWPNRQLKLNNSILKKIEGIELLECLRKCQERENCLSAIFSPSACILSTISPNTVYSTRMHFEYSEEFDLYENNCRGNDISNFDSQCTWMRIKSAGLPNQWDTRERTEDVEDCERMCLVRDRDGDPCRSYTFDSTAGYCYLSTISARLSGRSALEYHEPRYTHGDLDDCTDFSLHCQETGLELRGTSIRRFSGFIRTKEGKSLICNKPVDGTYEFSIKMGFEECGFKKFGSPFPSYKGVVHVKEGSTPLITIRDKVLQVECRLHDQIPVTEQQTIAVNMMIEEGNRTDKILSNRILMVPSKSHPLPKYSLRVLDTDGSQSETVKYGDHGWIQVTMNQKEVGSSFSVSKLEARDMKTNHRLALLDDEGCVTNGSLVERITRPRDGEMNILVNYEFFDHGAEIVFFAYAQTCTVNCDPKCNDEYFGDRKQAISSSSISMRTKRAISERSLELSQDLYPLHGGRVMLLSSSDSKVPGLTVDIVQQVEIEQPTWSDVLLQCLFNDSTCLFSFTLASLQFCLLSMCFIVMYCYVRQYRHYRALNSEPTPTRIQQTKY